MIRLGYSIFLTFFLLSQALTAQVAFDFSDDAVIDRLREDIYTLASEEMEGREAGTEGERKAAAYIKKRMQEIGLQPMFDGSFYQEFPFPGEWVWGFDNTFTYRGESLIHGEDYYVLPGAKSGQWTTTFADVGFGISGLEGLDSFEDYCDYADLNELEGKFFIMEFFLPEAIDTVVDIGIFSLIFQKIRTAEEKGAAGILFVNTQSTRDDPPIDLRMSRRGFSMPLLFAEEHVLEQLMAAPGDSIFIETDIYREDNTAINVAGYLDNQGDYTVVIGGHYDHLGYGAQGSRSPGSNAIHPGADDNASGIAGLLEAARYITNTSDASNYNYIFIAFSAEEKGLVGSRYFTNSDAYDMDKINYMFNFDMIGRFEDEALSLIGTGSSSTWDPLIDKFAPEHFTIRKNPGGRGGSDHTSFYVKDIPVIFFFTGIHDDYHKPSDTADKINYEGAREILNFALDMVMALEDKDKLAFSTAPAPETTRRRSEMVTLGVMPDHAYDGEGLRIVAVTEGRAAQKAGLENGDVIIKINDTKVLEIHTYMEAMGGLRQGNTAIVRVVRGDKELDVEVEL